MLHLSSPDILFNKQKIFRIEANVENNSLIVKQARVIIVYEFPEKELADSLKTMIDKLIQACLFSLHEVVYVNQATSGNITLGSLQTLYRPEAILVFGKFSLGKNMQAFKKNVPFEMNGMIVLCTDDIGLLDKSKEAKGALWMVLKKMFKLK